MTFKEQIVSTFIGSGAGFLTAMFIFVIKEKYKTKNEKISMYENFRKEIIYNIATLEEILNYIEKRWKRIANYHQMRDQDKQHITFRDYLKFPIIDDEFILSKKITKSFFNQGKIFDIIEPEELKDIEFFLKSSLINDGELDNWESEYFYRQHLPTAMDSRRHIALAALKLNIETLKEISIKIEKKRIRTENQNIFQILLKN